MINNLYKFKKNLADEGVILCFSGVISQDILSGFATIIEKKLEKLENLSKVQNIFAVFVEMVQNMLSYSSDATFVGNNIKESSGVIIIGYNENTEKYFVKSGNTIKKNTQQKISEKIDNIKDLSKDELKVLYKELRKSGKNTHERGGGLGFLEIQKKSSEPIEYSFDEIDDQHSFFCLKSII